MLDSMFVDELHTSTFSLFALLTIVSSALNEFIFKSALIIGKP